MHVITRKRLNEFAKLHPDTTNALAQWYRLMKQNNFASLVELREMLTSAERVGKLTVFNIGGNKVRLRSCGSLQPPKNLHTGCINASRIR